MGLDEAAVDCRLEVHGMAGLPFIDHHVVEGERAHRVSGFGPFLLQTCRQQRTPILAVAAGENRVHILQHRFGADADKESQPARLMPSSGTE